jgi:hypothetical protein
MMSSESWSRSRVFWLRILAVIWRREDSDEVAEWEKAKSTEAANDVPGDGRRRWTRRCQESRTGSRRTVPGYSEYQTLGQAANRRSALAKRRPRHGVLVCNEEKKGWWRFLVKSRSDVGFKGEGERLGGLDGRGKRLENGGFSVVRWCNDSVHAYDGCLVWVVD